jgi:hypothetical protein
MEQWAVVVADSLLLAVTLAGGIVTMLRAQQISRRASLLATVACLIVACWLLYQLVWWLISVPAAHTDSEIAAGAGYANANIVLTGVVISVAVALLFGAVNLGSAVPAAVPAAEPAAGAGRHAAPSGRTVPAQANGYAQRPAAGTGAPAGTGVAAGTPATAGGWTPPQQAHPNDWNIQSGVWSIPRGTFDGPPPDDSGRR